ncbi:uncharacterized protein LOC128715241 [Anopheles marshallii]|uniref:uncharacterized protein LOC128715241 n=1 Tax=Anopheles marshallii TaxID=1521116 RepID=UPI00237BA70A|nr:uncharacterized protein LOC128715241 [Anopheles marshallii]
MYPTKFTPNCFKCFPLHRAAAKGSLPECAQVVRTGEINPYQPTQDGWTALHVAIANKAEKVVDLLLDRYEQDWAIVRQTIKHQFLWKVEQTGWKSRPILIAWTEEECEAALNVVSSCPAGIPLNLQIFVLLRNPTNGHRFVALDVCNRTKWCDIMRLVRRLLGNGVLSIDRCDMRRDVENYLHVACALSTKDIIVKLISRGASLTVASGLQRRTPLMAAGEKMRKDVIVLLTTTYADRFDPFACDGNHYTVLHRMMHRQHTEMVDYFVNLMLNYRTKKLHEPRSVALSRIFLCEFAEDSTVNVWNFVRSVPMKKLCEKYIRDCQLDVRIRLRDTTTLSALISRDIALQYCFEQIEQDLTLLQLQDNFEKFNILHNLIRCKHLAFVEALYRKHSTFVKAMFEVQEPENDAPFKLLRLLMYNSDEQGIQFVLKYHCDFYRKDMTKLREVTVQQQNCSKPSHGKVLEVIAEALPELREDIESIKLKNNSPQRDFYEDLRNLCDHFAKTVTKLEANGKRLDDYLDTNRKTFLHAAVSWSNKSLIENLLSRNMDVMKLDDNGCLPIHLVYRSESIFEMLLRRNEMAQLSYINEAGYNLLHISCRNGLHGTILEPLVEHGMDVNGPTPDGQLPLSLASCCATITFLLDRGARVDLLNGDLLSSNLNHMHYCAAIVLIPRLIHLPWFRQYAHMYLPWMLGEQSRYCFSSSTGKFLETYPDIRRLLFDSLYEHSKSEMAELFARVCHNAIPCCVQWFLEYDYDIDYNYPMWGDSTPLLGLLGYVKCDIEEHFRMVEKLLQKSIDVNATNNFGQNALMILANGIGWMNNYGHLPLELASLLLKREIRVDQQDAQGNTALHNAFERMQWEMVDFLIENGANVSIRNNSNKLACQMGLTANENVFGFIK